MRDALRDRLGRSGRWLAASALALGAVACGGSTVCDNSYPTVDVIVVGGADAFTSYALTGACSGGGTPADCQSPSCDGATPCPCHLFVPIRPDPTDASTTGACRIQVAATAKDTYFVVDVGVIDWSAGCRHVELADTSQSTITVDF